ncbi:entericidin EcnA/B family protein [Sphingomonas sp. ASV193]
MVRQIITFALIGAGLTIAACNTVHGVAKDMNSAANATQNAMH